MFVGLFLPCSASFFGCWLTLQSNLGGVNRLGLVEETVPHTSQLAPLLTQMWGCFKYSAPEVQQIAHAAYDDGGEIGNDCRMGGDIPGECRIDGEPLP